MAAGSRRPIEHVTQVGRVDHSCGLTAVLARGRGVYYPRPSGKQGPSSSRGDVAKTISSLLEAWNAATSRPAKRWSNAPIQSCAGWRTASCERTAAPHPADHGPAARGLSAPAPERPGTAETREAFFRLMAAEMRRRLVDHARRRLASKRGGGAVHEQLSTSAGIAAPETANDIEAVLARLDQALVQLSASFPRTAHVVQLRFLAGLTYRGSRGRTGTPSAGTVKRKSTFARAWLAAAIDSAPDSSIRPRS